MTLDLSTLPSGKRYEDTYGLWLKLFESLTTTARSDGCVTITAAPRSWVPLLTYLGHKVSSSRVHFDEDSFCPHLDHYPRGVIEALCSLRPETADALWKVDAQWGFVPKDYAAAPSFLVTCNGSFHRPEIFAYLKSLHGFTPAHRKCVLVPCAADKPYPSELHSAVSRTLPNGYHLIIVTGVLGVVPQELWPVMPHYDSGVPNRWRAMQLTREYFTRHKYEHIIAYTDFYNEAISAAATLGGFSVDFVNEVKFYSDYLDLLAPERLDALRAKLHY